MVLADPSSGSDLSRHVIGGTTKTGLLSAPAIVVLLDELRDAVREAPVIRTIEFVIED